MKKYMDIKEEVKEALEEGKPVVALETTIISHGMPYPQNVKTALEVENIIRDRGAFPATIAILNGKIKVGLDRDEIEYLGKAKDVKKVSRRDLPFIIAERLNGATTVASTMIIANLAGIKVFVTGGIGGVHRGAEKTFDISADLQELARTNVAVVCAGAKSILDLGLTLEYLETFGVPVVGFKTEEFPAFFTRKSGFKLDYRIEDEEKLAKTIKTKWDLGLDGGVVVANPIPKEYEMDPKVIDKAIKDALNEAENKGIKGKDVTPFLLDKVKKITGGRSLQSNIELVYNNAVVGANLAVMLEKLYIG
ncbi:pseudouridine-5'-phosphate glycosidase [Clostridium sp. Cult1]|uniref:pseudouridine-5'-phosphate glycosidase n=1 Tax=Clostridium sp. Cult1 TaxID=2079002 RepID=UPI00235168FC|nr:pseudouridine-5'-phosphate glycosidase [Clostridium sp. Cult1]